jgi:hypothetical protein
MEDLLLSVLAAIAELFLEVLLEVFLEALVALGSRATRSAFAAALKTNRYIAPISCVLLGVSGGLLSVLVFPQRLVHTSRFHGVSLLVSPVITGLVMSQIGRAMRRRGQESVEIESFGYGFAFALAVALVRLFLVK